MFLQTILFAVATAVPFTHAAPTPNAGLIQQLQSEGLSLFDGSEQLPFNQQGPLAATCWTQGGPRCTVFVPSKPTQPGSFQQYNGNYNLNPATWVGPNVIPWTTGQSSGPVAALNTYDNGGQEVLALFVHDKGVLSYLESSGPVLTNQNFGNWVLNTPFTTPMHTSDGSGSIQSLETAVWSNKGEVHQKHKLVLPPYGVWYTDRMGHVYQYRHDSSGTWIDDGPLSFASSAHQPAQPVVMHGAFNVTVGKDHSVFIVPQAGGRTIVSGPSFGVGNCTFLNEQG